MTFWVERSENGVTYRMGAPPLTRKWGWAPFDIDDPEDELELSLLVLHIQRDHECSRPGPVSESFTRLMLAFLSKIRELGEQAPDSDIKLHIRSIGETP